MPGAILRARARDDLCLIVRPGQASLFVYGQRDIHINLECALPLRHVERSCIIITALCGRVYVGPHTHTHRKPRTTRARGDHKINIYKKSEKYKYKQKQSLDKCACCLLPTDSRRGSAPLPTCVPVCVAKIVVRKLLKFYFLAKHAARKWPADQRPKGTRYGHRRRSVPRLLFVICPLTNLLAYPATTTTTTSHKTKQTKFACRSRPLTSRPPSPSLFSVAILDNNFTSGLLKYNGKWYLQKKK